MKQLDVFRLLKSKKMARPFPQLWQYVLHQLLSSSPCIWLTFTQEYYHKTYNIRLSFPDIIGIELSRGSGKNTVIPAELCTVAAGQRYTRKLPQNMTSMMVDFSKFRPEKRLEMIVGQKGDRVQPPVSLSPKLRFISYFCPDAWVCYLTLYSRRRNGNLRETDHGTRSDSQITYHLLRQETGGGKLLFLHVAQFSEILPQDVNNGAWNITRQHLHSPEIIRAWAVVDYSLRLDQSVIKAFMDTLEQCCTARGMLIALLKFSY